MVKDQNGTRPMVRSLLSVFVKKGHGSVSGLAALRFKAVSSERTGCSPLPKQGRLKDVTSGPLSLRRAGVGPCERSNQESRRNRTCGRRCGRRGLCAVAAVRPRLASPLAVLKGFGSFRHILCGRDLRWPRQSYGGRPRTPESQQW